MEKKRFTSLLKVINGLSLHLTRWTLTLLGLLVVVVTLVLITKPDLRLWSQWQLLHWLNQEPAEALEASPSKPPKAAQENLARFLSQKYRIALSPVQKIVTAAFEAGARSRLDPSLILAVAAVESGFNPYAKNAADVAGVMQIKVPNSNDLGRVGGNLAAFDTINNVRIGTTRLLSAIQSQGSLEKGLLAYTHMRNQARGTTYVQRVLQEQQHMLHALTAKRGHP